jgi:fatty-acyl-CoA synthase
VPVIWLNMLAYLERTGKNLTKLSSVRVGGSSAPRAMIEAYEARGIQVFHGWGMTETSPTCTTGTLRWEHRTAPDRLEYQLKAGRVVYGTQMRIVDEAGRELPNDGESAGELQVRGPWVISAYYDNEAATAQQFTSDGWFKTGDIATLDRFGHLAIHDRSKDVIKSGGEWISSIDLENAAVSHPDVAEAAAIAIPHPKWAERPLLIVVRRPGGAVDRDELLAHLAERVAKWWLPDDVVFVAEIPHTATGKISKKTLRERFAARALS